MHKNCIYINSRMCKMGKEGCLHENTSGEDWRERRCATLENDHANGFEVVDDLQCKCIACGPKLIKDFD